jgi:hypothetical protein
MHNSCIEKREGGARRQDEDDDEEKKERGRQSRPEKGIPRSGCGGR